MDSETRKKLKKLIFEVIENKLQNYSPETVNMPFFEAIFSKEHVITASLIQSFYTSFGMSVYEQMAEILAHSSGFEVKKQYRLHGKIDKKTETKITAIHSKLRLGSECDYNEYLKVIKKSILSVKDICADADRVVDLFIKKPNGEEYYFGITTVKPNKEGFSTHARKLLRWSALRLSVNKSANIRVGLVIPYNPYAPDDYNRWACKKMFGSSLYVGKTFWDFVGNELGTYEELLTIFEEIGFEVKDRLREMIDKTSNS